MQTVPAAFLRIYFYRYPYTISADKLRQAQRALHFKSGLVTHTTKPVIPLEIQTSVDDSLPALCIVCLLVSTLYHATELFCFVANSPG
jgi:hypothetical protein